MRSFRAVQVVLLTIVWAFVLLFIAKKWNAAPTYNTGGSKSKAQMVLTFTHFCCSGCYDKMFSAVSNLSWVVSAAVDRDSLKKQLDVQGEQADTSKDLKTAYNKDAVNYLDEKELNLVDFMRVDRTYRDAGLVVNRMVLKNIPHFRLIAKDPHLCCGICKTAAEEGMKKLKTLSFVVDKDSQTVVAEYRSEADVSEFKNALEDYGFAPKEIVIEVLPN